MSRRKTRPARRGYVLVMFAMLAFAFFALAALVIDMGMVRLTQRQMQSATDSAALEGLRFRDGIPSVLWPPGIEPSENPTSFQAMVFARIGSYPDPTTAVGRDQIRRAAASQMVSIIFDDDLNPNDTDTSDNGQPGNYGAGAVVNFSGGAGSDPSLAASQLLTVPPPGERTYNPGQQNGLAYQALQTNLVTTGSTSSQQPYGDMVSGTYTSNTSYNGPYNGWSEETAKAASGGTPYERRDFIPDIEPGNSPDPAFLVRMRRLNPNDFQPGIDSENLVSTSGPTLPFLFARGSMMLPTTATSYQPRVDGLTVRATGIASVDAIPATETNAGAPSYCQPIALAAGRCAGLGTQPDDSNVTRNLLVEGQGSVALIQSYWSSWLQSTLASSATPVALFQTLPLGDPAADPPATTLNLNPLSTPAPLTVPPVPFIVQIESELMTVTVTGGDSWTVTRGAQGTMPVAHAAGFARLLSPVHLDMLGNIAPFNSMGNLLDAPLVAQPTSSTLTTLTSAVAITGTTHVQPWSFSTPLPIALVGPGSNAVASVMSVNTTSSPIVLTLASSILPPGPGSQVEFILAAKAVEPGDQIITVSAPPIGPGGYLPDPDNDLALSFVLLIHDPSTLYGTALSAFEYVRVLDAASTSNNQYQLTVQRGLFGTAPAVPYNAGWALTPVVGFAPTTSAQTVAAAAAGTQTLLMPQVGDYVAPPATVAADVASDLSTTVDTWAPLLQTPVLIGAVAQTDQSITVSSIAGLPVVPAGGDAPAFVVCVDDEMMLVASAEANDDANQTYTMSVNRAINNTAAASHQPGALVALVAGSIIPVFDDVTDESGDEFSGRVEFFGRAIVAPDPNAVAPPLPAAQLPAAQLIIAGIPPAGAATSDTASLNGTIAENATHTPLKPIAADLGGAEVSQLWDTLLALWNPPQGQPPAAPLLRPVLASTNVPPLPQQ